MALMGPTIQPMSDMKKKRSSGLKSRQTPKSSDILATFEICVHTAPLGLPVVPEV